LRPVFATRWSPRRPSAIGRRAGGSICQQASNPPHRCLLFLKSICPDSPQADYLPASQGDSAEETALKAVEEINNGGICLSYEAVFLPRQLTCQSSLPYGPLPVISLFFLLVLGPSISTFPARNWPSASRPWYFFLSFCRRLLHLILNAHSSLFLA